MAAPKQPKDKDITRKDFEAASREFWRKRHELVKQMPESQYTLMNLSRIPWFLWEATLPSTLLVLGADIAHSYFKGIRTGSLLERARQSGPVALRTTMRFSGLVVLQQLTEHGALQALRLGERFDPDPYERLSHLATVRVLSGLAAGAAVAALGKHGFSFYHATTKAAKHPRHVYTGAWALTGGFLGLNATPLIESVTRTAMRGWNEALGTPPPAVPNAAPAQRRLAAAPPSPAAQPPQDGESR